MDRYDAEITPDAKAWLAMDETEQQLLVERYHRKAKISPPNPRLHAIFHVLVETQLASREPGNVVATMERLMHGGLSRHDAIHAIASVASSQMYSALNEHVKITPADYAAALNKLTADSWYEEYGEGADDEDGADDGWDEDDDEELEDDEK